MNKISPSKTEQTLHQRALEAIQNYKRCEKDLLEVFIELDRTKAFLAFGVSSLFRYGTELLGLSEGETFRFTQVSRKAVVVPELRAAIGSGKLTVSKASRVAPVITRKTSESWIEKAATLPQRTLEVEVARVNPKATSNERLRVLTPELRELKITLSDEVEGLLRRAQEVLRTKNFEETMRAMLEITLNAKDPVRKAERVKRIKTPKTYSLGRPASSARTAIPAAVKHQVFLRDKGRCQFAQCGESRYIQIHHKRLVAYGGSNALGNLITLCHQHHGLKHQRTKLPSTQPRSVSFQITDVRGRTLLV